MTTAGASPVLDAAVRLRALRRDDLPALWAWYQDPELVRHLVGGFRFHGEAEALAYMERWLAASDAEVRCAIERIADGALLGMTMLTGIDRTHRTAEAHVFLGDASHRGKGYGRAAVTAMMAHGFGDLGLNRLDLSVLATNAAALHMYQSVGFEIEGTRRRAAFKDGRFVDVVMMGALAERFEAIDGRPGA